MPPPRRRKGTNPISIVLAGLLTIGFLIFIFSNPGDDARTSSDIQGEDLPSKQVIGSKDPAINALSPPSQPFRKAKNPQGRPKAPPVVHYKLNDVTTSEHPAKNRESVLILTPLARFYPAYFDNLLKISYPHELISIGFIIPKNAEGNLATKQLQERITDVQAEPEGVRFASITILRQDFDSPLQTQSEVTRHRMENQKVRRAAMAKARNSLLFTTLGPTTSWVLWLDGDIVETPTSIIQDLARHNKAIIVPNCFQRFRNSTGHMDTRPYDYNSWVESELGRDLAKDMDEDDILLEGYSEMATYRTLLARMHEGEGIDDDPHLEVELDGVGGTALLVKAEVHRDGAMFPPFAFYHLIETEGFAKMASRLGWKSFGLPNYYVCFPFTTLLEAHCIFTNICTGIPCQ